MISFCCCFLALLLLLSISANADPIKVFVLAGQSNMVGTGKIDHLDDMMAGDCRESICKEMRKKLIDEDGGYQVFDEVLYKFGDVHGPLTIERYGGYAMKQTFGPDVGFGLAVTKALDETILIIKTAWGGKDLSYDFRPPSSGEGGYPTKYNVNFTAGYLYEIMIDEILGPLENLTTYFPEIDDFELAGFVWFQGFNDYVNYKSVLEYEVNLANLIRDVRKDLGTPELPFIIGELGMHGEGERYVNNERAQMMRAAQRDVTEYDEFAGNTVFVRTAPFIVDDNETYWEAYHYYGRADYCYEIGRALGEGMLELVPKTRSSSMANRPWSGLVELVRDFDPFDDGNNP